MENNVPQELQGLVRQAYMALMKKQGGVPRRGQQQMIGAIARAVSNAKKIGKPGSGERMLAINAPTGTGKSFSYGIGAIPIALANDLKVVISTSNVALQGQLMDRDLVALAGVVPGLVAAAVKGRARYACQVKMRRALAEGVECADEVAALLSDLDSKRWSGDADELQQQPSKAAWSKCTNDRRGCSGKKCSEYAACPYYLNRASIEGANVLVTNHNLLLADARAGFVVLPKPENTVYVVDEAHELPAKAVAAQADGHALEEGQEFAIKCGRLVADVRRLAKGTGFVALAEGLGEALGVLGGALGEAKMAIGSTGRATRSRDESRPVRFPGGKLDDWLKRVAVDCWTSATSASKAVSELMAALQSDAGDVLEDKVRERLLGEVGMAAGSLEGIVWVWKLMTDAGSASGPIAKWVEICEKTRDLRVCASPIGVAEYLHEAIWSKAAAVVHLSGTLSTVGGMEPYLRESGLSLTEGVRTLGVDTPFDYERQARLIVPRMVSPKDTKGHTRWLVDNVPGLIAQNGAGRGVLVLFTSLKQLREVADGMPQWVQDVLLAQDRMPKKQVLAKHKAAIDAGKTSVIFGSSSYDEGVDLPGRLCTLVVVAKLPFQVPADPVAEELKEHIESNGGSFFDEVAMPRACRRLTQQSGRLIRSETDCGALVVADPRLTDTRYGRAMLACLPPFSLSRELVLNVM